MYQFPKAHVKIGRTDGPVLLAIAGSVETEGHEIRMEAEIIGPPDLPLADLFAGQLTIHCAEPDGYVPPPGASRDPNGSLYSAFAFLKFASLEKRNGSFFASLRFELPD